MAIPIVGRMAPEDIDAVMPIERQSFQQPWSHHMYLMDLITNQMATYLVIRPAADDGDRLPPILAYGGFWLMLDEAHIATIASHPDWRGCGLGHTLLLALLEAAVVREAAVSTLEVRVSNKVARRMYEQVAYKVAGTRRRYYQDGEDALIMTTPLLTSMEMQEQLAQQRQLAQAKLSSCFGRVPSNN